MDLDFTTDQDELRSNVRDVLAGECTRGFVRSFAEDDDGAAKAADALWTRMVELGWPALTVPEEHGGLGLSTVEAAIVSEELGRVLAPVPFLATVTQFVALLRDVDDAERLAAVAAGTLTGTLALAEASGSFHPLDVAATARPDRDGYSLAGTKTYVFDADRVDELAVVARAPGTTGIDGLGVFAVRGTEASIDVMTSLDLTRRLATVVLDGVRVGPDAVLAPPGPDTAKMLSRVLHEATTAVALDAVGACQTIFDDTLEYAKQREQFGVPIGSFQAIKHKLADSYVLLERARATAYFAALTIAEDDDRRALATSVAKSAAGDCEVRLGKEGIQIHGGIGYTWEHDMHLFVRRVIGDGALFGTAGDHRARIANALNI